jgi:hypothetical protein
MKFTNELRLARIASNDVWQGGARALHLAKRMRRMTGNTEGEEIVSRVYTRSDGKGVHECPECGGEYLTACEASACCQEGED